MSSMSGGILARPLGQRRHRDQAAGAALAAIGEEQVGAASGAKPQQVDPFRPHAGPDELIQVGPPEVEHPLPRPLRGEPFLPHRREGGLEPVDHRHGGPTEGIERSERAEQVRCALDGLPHDYRVVIVLREIDGLSYDEIGFSLGIAVGTVKSRLARAREGLRAQLRDE